MTKQTKNLTLPDWSDVKGGYIPKVTKPSARPAKVGGAVSAEHFVKQQELVKGKGGATKWTAPSEHSRRADE